MSSSLKRRLERTKRSGSQKENMGLVPLSILDEYVSEHPLVTSLRIPPSQVQSFIARLHACTKEEDHAMSGEEEEEETCASCGMNVLRIDQHSFCVGCGEEGIEVEAKREEGCFECGGYVERVIREGVVVCNDCGACRSETIGTRPEYQGWSSVTQKKKGKVPGVGWKMVFSSQKKSVKKKKERWTTLESWNEEFVHLTTDELRYAEHLLEHTPGASEDVACVAALLYVRTRDGIPTEQEIRRKLLKRQPLQEVGYSLPPPLFPCSHCSAMHHVQKSARYCCKTRGR